LHIDIWRAKEKHARHQLFEDQGASADQVTVDIVDNMEEGVSCWI